MSTFSAMFGSVGLPGMFDHFGRDAIYTPKGGEAVTLKAMVATQEADKQNVDQGQTEVERATITIMRDPDGPYGGVDQPDTSATIEIDGVTWAVEGIQHQSETDTRLLGVRVGVVERSRGGYRGAYAGRGR